MTQRAALIVPTLWGLLLGVALAEIAREGDLFTTIWVAFGLLTCPAAIAVIATTQWPTARCVWLWAIAPIPASFCGPLALVLLSISPVRCDLRDALSPRRWRALTAGRRERQRRRAERRATEAAREHRAQPTAQQAPSGEQTPTSPAPAIAATTEPQVLPRGQQQRRSEQERWPPPSVRGLIALLLGSIVIGCVVFIGVVTLVVLGGAHELSAHDIRVMLLIGALSGTGAAVISTGQWVLREPPVLRRASVALPLAALALAVIFAITAWMWIHASS
jgi:hypothetical protein